MASAISTPWWSSNHLTSTESGDSPKSWDSQSLGSSSSSIFSWNDPLSTEFLPFPPTPQPPGGWVSKVDTLSNNTYTIDVECPPPGVLARMRRWIVEMKLKLKLSRNRVVPIHICPELPCTSRRVRISSSADPDSLSSCALSIDCTKTPNATLPKKPLAKRIRKFFGRVVLRKKKC